MPNIVLDLIVDRVDLVKEGANSAAFIELYKRKEPIHKMTIQEIMKEMGEEAAAVVQAELTASAKYKADLDTANESLSKAMDDLKEATDGNTKLKEENDKLKEEQKAKEDCTEEEEMIKALPESAKLYFETMKAQKAAAEELLRKSNEEKLTSEATAKAAMLKSLPVEQEKLIAVLKGASPEMVQVLETVCSAIDVTVLGEVGKSAQGAGSTPTGKNVAWAKIEAEAATLAKAKNIDIPHAVTEVIKQKPELYTEYLKEGAN